jgi:hypothetical protein
VLTILHASFPNNEKSLWANSLEIFLTKDNFHLRKERTTVPIPSLYGCLTFLDAIKRIGELYVYMKLSAHNKSINWKRTQREERDREMKKENFILLYFVAIKGHKLYRITKEFQKKNFPYAFMILLKSFFFLVNKLNENKMNCCCEIL